MDGILPDEECIFSRKPSSSIRIISLRIVAELKDNADSLRSVFEPIGSSNSM
jgi:hypothetical protein